MIKKIFPFFIVFCCIASSALSIAGVQQASQKSQGASSVQQNTDNQEDTDVIFPVKKTSTNSSADLDVKYPMDLKDPDNVKSTVVYDPVSGQYFFYTKVGNTNIVTPLSMTADEYLKYSLQHSMQTYWHQRNDSIQKSEDSKYSLTDMKFSLGPADKLFGPGGVQVKMQGSAELDFGIRANTIDNPTYPLSLRRPAPTFDFNEKIQVNVNTKVGDKINFNLNYNTESSFANDQQNVKLAYTGKDDEIVRKLEAGNVSMPLNSSLISGSTSLFGIKTELQFGKLNVVAIASEQQSQTKTVNTKGGVQTNSFDITCDKYDANKHFFLSQYFYNNFNHWMNNMPYVSSGITINRVEIWVTNKKGDYSQARNIIAFSDIGEATNLTNSHWTTTGVQYPSNGTNSLYKEVSALSGIRTIQTSGQVLQTQYSALGVTGGHDYEQVQSARMLSSSEYTLNAQLGYVTLNSALNSDDVLAVAYSYTSGGNTYQVGEFSTDGIISPQSLIVKLVKNTNYTPFIPLWKLMMRNVYNLGGSTMQKTNFTLNVMYRNDSTGINLAYINEGSSNIKGKPLIKVLNVDNLNAQNQPHPDGFYDYVEGYTAISNGCYVIFPVTEPFGSYLTAQINNPTLAKKYAYQVLYDSTLVTAQQYTSLNKFHLVGSYKGTAGSASLIQLNATNIPRGSVVVTAGGTTLVENQDYTVDYMMGTVTILNQSIISAGTSISVKLENQSLFNLQRETLVGTHLEYAFSKDFTLGGTFMHLSEMPLTTNVAYGNDPISNTMWGMNTSYRTESMWLTDMLNKIPLLNLTKPSSINVNAEFAQLIAGNTSGSTVYVDDFEGATTNINLSTPYSWTLASTPVGTLFPEASLTNDVNYGKNRALLNWFTIDQSVFAGNSSLAPSYISGNKDLLSNNLTRQVLQQEIFPNLQSTYGTSTYLPILNLSYYPAERGPYNMDVTAGTYSKGMNANGQLNNPETRWGGMMRPIQPTNLQAANVQYIDFWMMDPFVNDTLGRNKGGDLYFNLGDISEDVLKYGYKFLENGLSTTGDTTGMITTVWGRIPTTQTTVRAFDNDANTRQYQDVGFTGLYGNQKFVFPTYQNYISQLKNTVSPSTIQKWQNDPFSPLNDPTGDTYRFYQNSQYDASQTSILGRYKRYNNPSGNSTTDPNASYSTAATSIPDGDDINMDNTMNQYENYYQYKVSLRRADLHTVGNNSLIDSIRSTVALANGKTTNVTWYHFQIPLSQYASKIGSISDFTSIRFMRMFMTNFTDSTFLRFGTLNLVRGSWIDYTQALYNTTQAPTVNGALVMTTVGLEQNGNSVPVNYVLPPGVSRQVDPSQPQVVLENEQSMSLQVTNLAPGDARAVYKNTTYDLRQYKRMHMFAHANKLVGDVTGLQNGELTCFIRVGSDLTNNYYEYEVPLTLTPAGTYQESSSNDRSAVWPSANEFDIALSALTTVKQQRNAERATNSSLLLTTPYSYYDPAYPQNKITVLGNPSLGEVASIMIGVRNNGRTVKSGTVWVDEFSLKGFNENGGWAGTANAAVTLSDLGTVNASGKFQTAGFGSIDQSLMQRSLTNDYQYNISTSLQLGKLFPDKAKLSIPMYFSLSNEVSRPEYNPLDDDILLSAALQAAKTTAAKDSILAYSETRTRTTSFNITNARLNIKSKTPQLYDPANFSFSYAYNRTDNNSPDYIYNFTQNYQATLNYAFSPSPKSWEPFKNIKAFKSSYFKLITDFNLNLIPSLIAFNANLTRSYSQSQLRDYGSGSNSVTDPSNPELSFSDAILLNHRFDFKLNLTKGLSLSFSSSTNSQIDEPNVPVDKALFPQEYQEWKDSIKRSIARLGRPLLYQQMFTVNYILPVNKLPYLDFINSKIQYTSNYEWQTGVTTTSSLNVGNTISSTSQSQADAQFNFEMLYNKIRFLNDVNKKFASTGRTIPVKPRTFKQNVTVTKGKSLKINHRLNTTKITFTAIDSLGRTVPLRYKTIDANTIEILATMKTVKAALTITTQEANMGTPKSFIEYVARTLMMIRRGSVTYGYTQNLTLPNFIGSTNWVGQTTLAGSTAPGVGFTFGIFDQNYVAKALNKGWIIPNDSIITPATYATTKTFEARLSLEPLPGLKIDLAQQWFNATQNSIEFMYAGMPTIFSGSFHMSYIAIGTAFQSSGNSSNNFRSAAFSAFQANRNIVANMIERRYAGQKYPTTGFMVGNPLAGTTYNASNGGVSTSSADVLIPAFLAAYGGSSVSSSHLGLFPSLLQSLPNWRISYDGLSSLPFISQYLKSLTINHAYMCTYSISSYTSYTNWASNGNVGFTQDVTTGNPVPSSQYSISSASIIENFSPLIGLDGVFKNSMSGKFEYRQQRSLCLDITSSQIVEALTREYVIGAGYTLKDFNVILKLPNKESRVKNNLTVRCDFSIRDTKSLLRDIETSDTQATDGGLTTTMKLSADYVFSSSMNLKMYFDRTMSNPLISTSFPMSTTDFGFAIKFLLTK